jgi:hypothetical protein
MSSGVHPISVAMRSISPSSVSVVASDTALGLVASAIFSIVATFRMAVTDSARPR